MNITYFQVMGTGDALAFGDYHYYYYRYY